VDVFTRGEDLVVRAELPGMAPEKDVDISLQEGVLTIRGERREDQREDRDGAYRIESSYGAFERSVMLPEGVQEEDISATYERGILEVVIAKAGELRAPKRIPVQVGDRGPALDAKGEKSD
jgi:HSP20 family protein